MWLVRPDNRIDDIQKYVGNLDNGRAIISNKMATKIICAYK